MHATHRFYVDLPEPSAKRLLKNRRLQIVTSLGPAGDNPPIYFSIPDDAHAGLYFEFDGAHYPEGSGTPDTLDASLSYRTYVVFSNESGSRQEKIAVTPIRVRRN